MSGLHVTLSTRKVDPMSPGENGFTMYYCVLNWVLKVKRFWCMQSVLKSDLELMLLGLFACFRVWIFSSVHRLHVVDLFPNIGQYPLIIVLLLFSFHFLLSYLIIWSWCNCVTRLSPTRNPCLHGNVAPARLCQSSQTFWVKCTLTSIPNNIARPNNMWVDLCLCYESCRK